MWINEEEILKICPDRKIYAQGKILVQLKNIMDLQVETSEDRHNLTVTAVAGTSYGRKYMVSAVIDKDAGGCSIRDLTCACTSFAESQKCCRHIAAVLIEFSKMPAQTEQNTEEAECWCEGSTEYLNDEWQGEITSEEVTSKELDDLLQYYVCQERNEFSQMHGAGDIELDVTLHIEYDRESMDLRIGRKQKYVVKNIDHFVRAIKEMKLVTYGKNLSFVHSQNAFTKEALQIVKLLLEIDTEEKYSYPSGWGRHSQQMRRSITLKGRHLDFLMEMYEGKKLAVQGMNGANSEEMPVIKENPKLPMRIIEREDGRGADITMDHILMLRGEANIYIFWNGTIYSCERRYYEELKGFLRLMSETMDNQRHNCYYYGSYAKLDKPELFLEEKDYAAFIGKVLPVAVKWLEVSIQGMDVEAYKIQEARFKIYLDKEQNGITCKCEVWYGEQRCNLLEGDTAKGSRDLQKEFAIRCCIEEYFDEILLQRESFYLHEEEKILEFLEYGIHTFHTFAEVYVTDAFKKLKIAESPKVAATVGIKNGLLEFGWKVEGIDPKELEGILADYRLKKKYHRLRNGDFVRIDESGLKVLAELSEGLLMNKHTLEAGHVAVPIYRTLYLDAVMKENADKLKLERSSMYKQFVREMKTTEDSEFEIPKSLKLYLRPYQENGFQWLSTLAKFGFGGILADDMGLGKTLQMLTFLMGNREGTSLVICPASLVYNWENECYKFAPDLKIVTVVGTASERHRYIEEMEQADVLITSYDLLKRDIEKYQGKQFQYQIIDEAQYIKNASTQAAKAVKAIVSKSRFAMTGTPIENSLSELWSIFDFLMPDYLYSYTKFKKKFELSIALENDEEIRLRLQRLIKPFILRRLKKDVLKELPDKLEEVVYARLSGKQKELYEANAKKLLVQLRGQSEVEFQNGKLELLSALTMLRQLCCHPGLYYDSYSEESAKLDLCVELVQNAVNSGHRILLFSQFTSMLDILEQHFRKWGITSLMLTGKTSKEQRRDLVQQFQEGAADVFLISLKAGGTGLNLTAADVVIHYDPWWNVAAQNQAADRAHRIGQTNVVTVLKIIAKDTIEEKILKMQERKADLADAIISEHGTSFSKISYEELLDALETVE